MQQFDFSDLLESGQNLILPKKPSEELAEETGWHIGDGSMNYYQNRGKSRGFYQLRGHIIDDKEHYLKRVKPIFKKLYNLDLSLRKMPSTGVFGFQIWNNSLVEFKNKLGLPLGKKWTVDIPQAFLEHNNLKIAVIRGIFDTDGCFNLEHKPNRLYPRLIINTISPNLGQQLHEILRDLEFRANLYKCKVNLKTIRPNVLYSIFILGDEMLKKFYNEIKPKNPKHMAKYFRYRKGL